MAAGDSRWLLSRALKSAALLAVASYLTGLVSFPANLALVRLVGPAQYGYYALAMAVLQSVYLLGGWSFHVHVVASAPDRRMEDSAFVLSVGLGLGLGLLVLLSGPMVRARWGAPVAALACALAGIRAMSLVSYLYAALLERRLAYGRFALVDSAASLLSFAPALWCATRAWGAWALVVRETFLATLSYLGYRLLAPRAFRWRPRRQEVRRLVNFGAPLALMQAGMTAFWSTDRLALGARGTPTAVGVYSQARYLADLVGTMLGPLVTQVAVPIYARSRPAQDADSVYCLLARIAIRAALLPVLLLLLFPDFLVHVLLGNRWAAVAELLPCFAPYVLLLPLVENQRSRLTGLHQMRRLALLSAIMLIGAAGGPLCAWLDAGSRAIALAVSGAMAALFLAGHRLAGCRFELIPLLAAPAFAATAAGLLGASINRGAWLGAPASLAATAGAYIFFLGAAEWRAVIWAWSLMREWRATGAAYGAEL